eukprot:998864_1
MVSTIHRSDNISSNCNDSFEYIPFRSAYDDLIIYGGVSIGETPPTTNSGSCFTSTAKFQNCSENPKPNNSPDIRCSPENGDSSSNTESEAEFEELGQDYIEIYSNIFDDSVKCPRVVSLCAALEERCECSPADRCERRVCVNAQCKWECDARACKAGRACLNQQLQRARWRSDLK